MTTSVETHGLFLNGRWTIPTRTFPNRNPADTRETLAEFAYADEGDVALAFEAARGAAGPWGRRSGLERGEVLFRAAYLLDQRAESIGRELTLEEGKTLAEGIGEARRAAMIVRYHAGECAQQIGDVYPSADSKTHLYSIRQPLGVVGVITPWNFPIAIPAWKIAPALAHGNAVVWKPSELTPLCAVRLVQALDDAGLPPGVLNLVTGFPQAIGDAFVDSPELDGLTFTGSTSVGRALQMRVIERGVKVQLELGGKNPIIVFDDALIEDAVTATVSGAFMSAGQKCTATSRALVHASVHDEFVGRLVERVRAFKVGDPLAPDTKMGPLVSENQLDRVQQFLARAAGRSSGELAFGGGRTGPDHGFFIEPTIYTDVPPTAELAQDEVFGPVLAVMRIDSEEQALSTANAVRYGLSASLFTQSLQRALAFARDVEAGIVHVNSETAGAEPQAPFGGMKASSSHSREQGKAAREFFTDIKTVYLN